MTEPKGFLDEGYEGQVSDEKETERDLGYEFSMPSPLKRTMTDLITSIANLARTFDPNNTNLELSRTLLTVALGQGLEMADPAAAVERILPEGYVDPMLAAQMQGGGGAPAQPGMPGGAPPLIPSGPNPFGPGGGTPPGEGPEGESNPYGVAGFSQDYQGNQGQMYEGAEGDMDPARMEEIMQIWDEELGELTDQLLAEAAAARNGHHE
jgi:hypothetical protein